MEHLHLSRGRHLAVVALLSVLTLLASACGAPGGSESDEDVVVNQPEPGEKRDDAGSSGDEDAVRVGFMASTTGVAAASGQDMVRGWDLYWDLNGEAAGGRTVRTIHVDDGGDPAVGLNKARRLVQNEDVHLVVGPLFANIGLAVGEYLSGQGVPNFQQVASADDLTQRQPLEGVLRVAGWTSSQPHHPLGQYAADQGYERAVTICSDYAFGHEVCGGFVNTFTDNGGEIVDQLWNPVGTQDFGTYIAQIQAANADVVFSSQVGGDSVRFVESWSSFGMKDSVPLLGGETLLDQSLLRNMGAEAEGLVSAAKFAEGRDDPVTQEFVEAFDEAYGDLPSYYASVSYLAAQWTAKALEETDGDIEDTDAFLEAVRDLQFEGPGGPVELDDYDNPIQNVYVREVQAREDGRLWNVPLETFEAVSQFWTYDVEQFLECPVYSREYQGDGVFPENC